MATLEERVASLEKNDQTQDSEIATLRDRWHKKGAPAAQIAHIAPCDPLASLTLQVGQQGTEINRTIMRIETLEKRVDDHAKAIEQSEHDIAKREGQKEARATAKTIFFSIPVVIAITGAMWALFQFLHSR